MRLPTKAIYIFYRSPTSSWFTALVQPVVEPGNIRPTRRGRKAGATVDHWGVVAKIDRFADDVLVWDYDKEDFSLRIDIVSGPLSEIALEPAMAGDSSTSRADMTSRANMACART